jgi:hypothetical protein
VAKWQKRLDTDFPNGAIARWERENSHPFRVSWLMVEGCVGLDPRLMLMAYGSDRVIGPMRLLSYTDLRDGMKKLVFNGIDESLVLSPRVPAGQLREAMTKERGELIKIWKGSSEGPGLQHPARTHHGVPAAQARGRAAGGIPAGVLLHPGPRSLPGRRHGALHNLGQAL